MPARDFAELELTLAHHLAKLIADTQLAAGLAFVLITTKTPDSARRPGLVVFPGLLLPVLFGQQCFVDAGLQQRQVRSVEAGERVVPQDLEFAGGVGAQAAGGDQEKSGEFGFDDVTSESLSGLMAARAPKDSGKPH